MKRKNPRASIASGDKGRQLVKERETFVRTVFKQGVKFTEQLVRENRRYRQELGRLRADNARLRAQIASEDAIHKLLITVERLEKERARLLARSRELERASERYEDRYLQMDKELNNLASLYIACSQLHGTLSPRRVLGHLGEILIQFVGAKVFVLYIIQPEGRLAEPIAWWKVKPSLLKSVRVGEGAVGEACLTGMLFMRPKVAAAGTLDDPLAVVPLTAGGGILGAISVVELLQQKKKWEPPDEELFKLVGSHAGSALIGANLYDRDLGPLIALQNLRDNLPRNSSGFGRGSTDPGNYR